jgi:hypothetical protein
VLATGRIECHGRGASSSADGDRGCSLNVAAATIPVASPSLPDKAYAMNSATMLTALWWIVQIAALRPVIQWRRCAKAWRNVILLDQGVYAKSCANGCRCRRPYAASGSDAVNGTAVPALGTVPSSRPAAQC